MEKKKRCMSGLSTLGVRNKNKIYILTKKLIVILQIFIKNKYAKKLFLQGFS